MSDHSLVVVETIIAEKEREEREEEIRDEVIMKSERHQAPC